MWAFLRSRSLFESVQTFLLDFLNLVPTMRSRMLLRRSSACVFSGNRSPSAVQDLQSFVRTELFQWLTLKPFTADPRGRLPPGKASQPGLNVAND
jgi:hypothetical protein